MHLRPYDQDHMFLLPPSLNEWIRQEHPTRVFSEIIDRLAETTFRQIKEALEKIFTDVIVVAQSMGMATLGLVAVDGSKVRANSGIDTFKRLEDWKKTLREARDEAQRIISEAEKIDKEEDRVYGKDKQREE